MRPRSSVFRGLTGLILFGVSGALPYPAAAALPPLAVTQAVVWIQCGDRQGSGTIINGEQGYVLTNAHVVINLDTLAVPSTCVVGLVDENLQQPKYFYRASPLRYSFNEARNQDFAILEILRRISPTGPDKPFPFLKTNEFTAAGLPISVIGYSGDLESLSVQKGAIRGFDDGYIQSSAVILPGDSGGAGLDSNNNLIGMPTRVVTITTESGVTQSVDYELVDIRAVMNWLDTYGVNEHDKFFTHADPTRYHQTAVFINQTQVGCEYVARTVYDSAVSCLLPGSERMIFPNEATFASWFPNYSGVVTIPPEIMRTYKLLRNVTFKPGTLVKSYTSPQVYVVIDSFGSMRWVSSEAKAVQFWGPNWANQVRDIPDEFFANYTIGQPLE